MDRTCITCGELRNAYRILIGRPEVRDHWECDIGAVLKRIGCDGVD
jgi:hypothetical protein